MKSSILALLAALVLAAPISNAFTYQGQLIKSGTPYSGNADFLFRLWNDAAAGTQVGSDVSIAGLPVTAGLFTADLDFGPVFDGSALWLEIQVRTLGGGYTMLTPRLRVAAAPYALHALSAPGGASQWTTGASGIHYLNNVGVGATASSSVRMFVNVGTENVNPFYATNNNTSYATMVLRNFGSNGFGLYDDTSARHAVAGRFGAGTMNPEYPLDVVNAFGGGMR